MYGLSIVSQRSSNKNRSLQNDMNVRIGDVKMNVWRQATEVQRTTDGALKRDGHLRRKRRRETPLNPSGQNLKH